jgi:23S rRNA pseudouridine955/2504/2580 synthase
VNKKRVNNTYKLILGDIVRIPPINVAILSQNSTENIRKANTKINLEILYEDDALLAINKPAGMAVHGGSGVSFGVIEYLRQTTNYKFLELVHRLDKETSGVLLLAKKRSALVGMHEQIRNGKCNKRYHAVISGSWQNAKQNLRFPLKKIVMNNGERKVFVDEIEGQESHTIIYLLGHGQIGGHVCSFVEAELKTGRTHQIRVHLSHSGYPIIGDEKYGNFPLNKQIEKQLNISKNNPFNYRMYLHAYLFAFMHPITGEYLEINAKTPWENEIKIIQDKLYKEEEEN